MTTPTRCLAAYAVLAASVLCASLSVAKPPAAPMSRTVTRPAATDGTLSVWFSPKGGCTEAVVEQIAQAKRTLEAQAYSFTSTEIAKAIAQAHQRGVKVRAVLDKSNETGKYSGATYLADAGVPVWIDAKHAIAHNKVIVIDGEAVVTGSFNFTAAAEKSNAENLLVIQGHPELAAAYARNFEEHLAHAEPYRGVGK